MAKVKTLLLCLLVLFLFRDVCLQSKTSYVTTDKSQSSFTVSEAGNSTAILIDNNDFPGVIRVIKQLQRDINKVTGAEPVIKSQLSSSDKDIIIIGTIGKNAFLDQLVKNKKIDLQDAAGKWEKFIITTVENPFRNINRALIILGSDKRGTIYGIYDLAEKIGVSPWYWWADVPVKKNPDLYVKPGIYSMGEPKVKYRGIFINDEAPALSGWAKEKFGTEMFNHRFYENVFELILRLKGNFLWPAMWGRAFYDDDSLNPKLADEYGIVIGTSHHEPMMRAHDEWRRYGSGSWNYDKNPDKLKEFWSGGIKRMGNYESIVTLGMRGDGDEPMSEESNISLLQKIVSDQRSIIKKITGKEIESIPQVWALYKEVQDYYDKGMRVPDDVTLLLCDDNWGNLRRLPGLNDKPRQGGYGIYYHYDYVGGPRNYKWLNTNQIERVWEQMRLAYEYGADKIWIVNVGDIKPMEFPIDFFLDYAWDPQKIQSGDLPRYYKEWAAERFGDLHSAEIAEILALYTKFNSRRKPELLSPAVYNLFYYREAETVVNDYNNLLEKARNIYSSIPSEYKDAFYQLVLHPVEACANLNELYYSTALNHLYEKQGRSSTSLMADKVKELFAKDAGITNYYNNILSGGKWNHMMDQTHIGYTDWQQPDLNIIPEVRYLNVPETPGMGIQAEGSDKWFPMADTLTLPEFDNFNKQTYYIELFNRGTGSYTYYAELSEPWLLINDTGNEIVQDKKISVNVDWNKIPAGRNFGSVIVKASDSGKAIINISAVNTDVNNVFGFVESNGYISIEAEHYDNASSGIGIIPNLGRTGSAVTQSRINADEDISPENNLLEYIVYFCRSGEINVHACFSPLLNFKGSYGEMRYGIAFDDKSPVIKSVLLNDTLPDWKYPQYWNEMVSNNIKIITTTHFIEKPGQHTLKIWLPDPGPVLQKIVIDTGGLKPGYLGPPESFYNRHPK